MQGGADLNEKAITSKLPTLQALVARAQAGDRSVLPELQAALDHNPEIWRQVGDLALQAQASWLALLAGQDLLLHESVYRKLESLRAELSGTDPSPLEKLLVERVLACWLQTCFADATYAQARGPQATQAVLRELQHRQESSQRRLLDAIKKLALVRKLLRPAVSPLQLVGMPVGEGPVDRPGLHSCRRTTPVTGT
jgi:hypothetical protein